MPACLPARVVIHFFTFQGREGGAGAEWLFVWRVGGEVGFVCAFVCTSV